MKNEERVKVRVRYRETDQMGVAHHSSYINWLEVARVEWMRQRGSSYKSMEDAGLVLAVVRCEVNYKRPAQFDDLVEIEVRLTELSQVRMKFEYRLFNADNTLLSTAVTELACLAKSNLRPTKIPESFQSVLEQN